MCRNKRQRKQIRLGFTLMEVLLVMAILVILGTLVATNFDGIFGGAKEKSARIQLDSFSKQLKLYKIDMGNYPSADQGLDGRVNAPSDATLAQKYPAGGYLDAAELPLDPWNNDYQYESAVDSSGLPGFVISSAGPDGQAGNDDDIIVKSR